MWIKTSDRQPPVNVVVNTRINDGDGIRNVQQLKRYQRTPETRSLWFLPDDSMYVYYTPNEWEAT